jgi:hypothetical protein
VTSNGRDNILEDISQTNGTPFVKGISVILWQPNLLMEETGVPGENHWYTANYWQTLSHNVVSSTPRCVWDSRLTEHHLFLVYTQILHLKIHTLNHFIDLIIIIKSLSARVMNDCCDLQLPMQLVSITRKVNSYSSTCSYCPNSNIYFSPHVYSLTVISATYCMPWEWLIIAGHRQTYCKIPQLFLAQLT